MGSDAAFTTTAVEFTICWCLVCPSFPAVSFALRLVSTFDRTLEVVGTLLPSAFLQLSEQTID